MSGKIFKQLRSLARDIAAGAPDAGLRKNRAGTLHQADGTQRKVYHELKKMRRANGG